MCEEPVFSLVNIVKRMDIQDPTEDILENLSTSYTSCKSNDFTEH